VRREAQVGEYVLDHDGRPEPKRLRAGGREIVDGLDVREALRREASVGGDPRSAAGFVEQLDHAEVCADELDRRLEHLVEHML